MRRQRERNALLAQVVLPLGQGFLQVFISTGGVIGRELQDGAADEGAQSGLKAARATAPWKKYMSLMVVVPLRIISAMASKVPSKTKSSRTCRPSAGQMWLVSQSISARSSA